MKIILIFLFLIGSAMAQTEEQILNSLMTSSGERSSELQSLEGILDQRGSINYFPLVQAVLGFCKAAEEKLPEELKQECQQSSYAATIDSSNPKLHELAIALAAFRKSVLIEGFKKQAKAMKNLQDSLARCDSSATRVFNSEQPKCQQELLCSGEAAAQVRDNAMIMNWYRTQVEFSEEFASFQGISIPEMINSVTSEQGNQTKLFYLGTLGTFSSTFTSRTSSAESIPEISNRRLAERQAILRLEITSTLKLSIESSLPMDRLVSTRSLDEVSCDDVSTALNHMSERLISDRLRSLKQEALSLIVPRAGGCDLKNNLALRATVLSFKDALKTDVSQMVSLIESLNPQNSINNISQIPEYQLCSECDKAVKALKTFEQRERRNLARLKSSSQGHVQISYHLNTNALPGLMVLQASECFSQSSGPLGQLAESGLRCKFIVGNSGQHLNYLPYSNSEEPMARNLNRNSGLVMHGISPSDGVCTNAARVGEENSNSVQVNGTNRNSGNQRAPTQNTQETNNGRQQ